MGVHGAGGNGRRRFGRGSLLVALVLAGCALSGAVAFRGVQMQQDLDQMEAALANTEAELAEVEAEADAASDPARSAEQPPVVLRSELQRELAALREDIRTETLEALEDTPDYASEPDQLLPLQQAVAGLQSQIAQLEQEQTYGEEPASAQRQRAIVQCLAWIYEEVERYRDGRSPSIYFAPDSCRGMG